MKRLKKLEQEVESLSPEEAAEFRSWFFEYDWEKWDEELEADVKAGKLDALAGEAKRDYEAGRTSEF